MTNDSQRIYPNQKIMEATRVMKNIYQNRLGKDL